jgi:Integrase core domain
MIGLLWFVLAVLASPFKSKLRLEAENAMLRHQLIVVRRRLHGRVRLTNHDRWFFIQLYRVARQITEAFPWNEAPRYMIRDRDRIYGAVVTRRLRAMGIRDKPIAPASPWQTGFAERLIGSIRRECLDHIIVFGEAHLRRILKSYALYYNETRTHLALDKNASLSRTVRRAGRILCRPVLGGLHHEFVRI